MSTRIAQDPIGRGVTLGLVDLIVTRVLAPVDAAHTLRRLGYGHGLTAGQIEDLLDEAADAVTARDELRTDPEAVFRLVPSDDGLFDGIRAEGLANLADSAAESFDETFEANVARLAQPAPGLAVAS